MGEPAPSKDELARLAREAASAATAPDRLRQLALHDLPAIRKAAARNSKLPAESLVLLLGDAEWQVRYLAAQNSAVAAETASAAMEAMAHSDDPEHRRAAGRSDRTPVAVLIELAGDADGDCRMNAARNKRTPSEVARGLLEDPEPSVRLGALLHPSVQTAERRARLTADLLRQFFAAHADGEYLFEVLAERYLWDPVIRTMEDVERFDTVWQQLVMQHFELVDIPSRGMTLPAVHRRHWEALIKRLVDEIAAKVSTVTN
jgi:hypothetical protein